VFDNVDNICQALPHGGVESKHTQHNRWSGTSSSSAAAARALVTPAELMVTGVAGRGIGGGGVPSKREREGARAVVQWSGYRLEVLTGGRHRRRGGVLSAVTHNSVVARAPLRCGEGAAAAETSLYNNTEKYRK
jgi:hypothetical protein